MHAYILVNNRRHYIQDILYGLAYRPRKVLKPFEKFIHETSCIYHCAPTCLPPVFLPRQPARVSLPWLNDPSSPTFGNYIVKYFVVYFTPHICHIRTLWHEIPIVFDLSTCSCFNSVEVEFLVWYSPTGCQKHHSGTCVAQSCQQGKRVMYVCVQIRMMYCVQTAKITVFMTRMVF